MLMQGVEEKRKADPWRKLLLVVLVLLLDSEQALHFHFLLGVRLSLVLWGQVSVDMPL